MPPVIDVQAFCEKVVHQNMEAEDTVVAALLFQNKALGVVYVTTAAWPGHLRRLEISGSKGTIVTAENTIQLWRFLDEKPEDEEIRKRFSTLNDSNISSNPALMSHEQHKSNLTAFLEAVEKDKPFEIDGREARKSVALATAIYQAARVKKY